MLCARYVERGEWWPAAYGQVVCDKECAVVRSRVVRK